ncbi:MAG: asparagine N-glycosylation enzyme membrane subunit Stt3 [Cognaticolwellia sp.]|jgi:asparagine N-glycosylation enzyme membrane subunit Stt3
MNKPNKTFNMVVHKNGEITPNVVTLNKSLNQEAELSVADKTTVIYCQFYTISDNKPTLQGSSFTIGEGATKTYKAKDHVDNTYYLMAIDDENALKNINLDELKLVDGQLCGIGLGGSRSGRIIVTD